MRGCKIQDFTDVIFFIVLGSLQEVILAPNWRPNSHCDSLWGVLDAKQESSKAVFLLGLFLGPDKYLRDTPPGSLINR